MVTDPPYGVEYDADWRTHATRKVNGKLLSVGAHAIGKVTNDDRSDWLEAFDLFSGNVIYCWHASACAVQFAQDIVSAGFVIRAQIIWAKNNMVIGRGDYHWKHEPCWYAVKKGKTSLWNGDRTQTTVWDIDKPMRSETGHSTQKPLECMARPIRNHSGDVYDPFVGSGTTLVAAENLNRKCYAMEISPAYVAVCLERMTTAFPHLKIERVDKAVAA